jgi:hypothetical protein
MLTAPTARGLARLTNDELDHIRRDIWSRYAHAATTREQLMLQRDLGPVVRELHRRRVDTARRPA